MHVHVVGCSPAWPNPGGAQSGYLVEEDGRRLLLDCGPGVLPRLRQLEPLARVDAIVDHALPSRPLGRPRAVDLRRALRRRPRGAAARALAAARRPRDPARARSRPLCERDPRALRACTSTRRRRRSRPRASSSSAYRMLHYALESYGLRVLDGDRTLAYTADSAPCDGLVELARDADLFLCEATLVAARAGHRGHLTADEALDAFTSSGARPLRRHPPAGRAPAAGRRRARLRRARARRLAAAGGTLARRAGGGPRPTGGRRRRSVRRACGSDRRVGERVVEREQRRRRSRRSAR